MIGVKSVKTYFGTNAERTAIPLSGFLPGDVFVETDTKITYQFNGMAWVKTAVDGSNYLVITNNLSDLNNAATARTNLGLVAGGAGDIWVEKTGDSMTGDLLMPITTIIQGHYFDQPLDPNANAISSHFREFSSGVPTNWTQVDAASTVNTNSIYSFWYLEGTPSDTSWKYRRQSGVNLESAVTSDLRLYIGPLFFFDIRASADIDYYFGFYRDNSGIDENTFSRIHLQWNSAGSQWRIRGELKDNTSGIQKNGTWEVFSIPINVPIWLTILLQPGTKRCITRYSIIPNTIGTVNFGSTIFNDTPTTALSYGNTWVQIHQTRGSGGNDRIAIGALEVVPN